MALGLLFGKERTVTFFFFGFSGKNKNLSASVLFIKRGTLFVLCSPVVVLCLALQTL